MKTLGWVMTTLFMMLMPAERSADGIVNPNTIRTGAVMADNVTDVPGEGDGVKTIRKQYKLKQKKLKHK